MSYDEFRTIKEVLDGVFFGVFFTAFNVYAWYLKQKTIRDGIAIGVFTIALSFEGNVFLLACTSAMIVWLAHNYKGDITLRIPTTTRPGSRSQSDH